MRSLRLVALALALAVAGFATPPVAAEPPEPPQLRKEGRWLVDSYGRVVLVHGVNLVWKHAPYVPPNTAEGFTEADAEWLADHGFNGARLGTLWAGVAPTGPTSVDSTYFTKWQRVMDALAERGIWMQLDFHQDQYNEIYGGEGAPAWAVKRPFPFSLFPPLVTPFPTGYWTPEQALVWDNFFAGKHGHLDAWAGAWKSVAAHWKDQPYLMGYDLLNEPSAGTEWELCLLTGCPDHYTRELQPAMEKALRKVREADPDNIVWFAPQQLAAGMNSPTFFEPVAGEEQLGLSWHSYCTNVFLQSQGVPIDTEGCTQFAAKAHTKALEETTHMNAVGLMSEFGATDDTRALEIDTAAADRAFTSWMYWAYKAWNDPTTADTDQGMFMDDADLSSTKPKITALVRTYPQATCGTPTALSFDPTNGDFSYSYTAGDCGGQKTEIFVSPLHYPAGYDVEVTGGVVTGTASHHRLLVQATAGSHVTVTIQRRS